MLFIYLFIEDRIEERVRYWRKKHQNRSSTAGTPNTAATGTTAPPPTAATETASALEVTPPPTATTETASTETLLTQESADTNNGYPPRTQQDIGP